MANKITGVRVDMGLVENRLMANLVSLKENVKKLNMMLNENEMGCATWWIALERQLRMVKMEIESIL